MTGTAEHWSLAFVLTAVLACQVRALAGLVRGRPMAPARRPLRVADLVWIALPVAVVLFLAGRSWIIAFDPGARAAAGVARVEGGRPASAVSPPLLSRGAGPADAVGPSRQGPGRKLLSQGVDSGRLERGVGRDAKGRLVWAALPNIEAPEPEDAR